MRGKEDAADYRYFPDPDLLPLIITDEMLKTYSDIPELPDEKKAKICKWIWNQKYRCISYHCKLRDYKLTLMKWWKRELVSKMPLLG